MEVNLVGWSRGAVAVVEVADWLNYYGCKCKMPGKWRKTRFKPVKVNFLGLYDPVSMHLLDEAIPGGFRFEGSIPSNVRFSAALWRTNNVNNAETLGGDDKAAILLPQLKYKGLSAELDFYIEGWRKTSHREAGVHPGAHAWMKEQAMAQGVGF